MEPNPFAAALALKDPPATRWPTPGAMAQSLDPVTKQTPALRVVDAELVALSEGHTERLMVFMPPQEGKLISDDTPVPTPDGWVRHGDLHPGSVVFHPSGRPLKVTEVHPPAQATLRVYFSDHTSVLVHPAHEWTVWDRALRKFVTRETGHLARLCLDSGPPGKRGHRYRFQLPFREPLDCSTAELPMDPYTLGVWLGDGSSDKAAVTHHPADRYGLAYPETAHCVHAGTGIITTYYGCGMYATLTAMGLRGRGLKHIPPAYLRASIEQRRALLAGLIDTDGHVSASGQVSFDNANERLVRDTAELIRTLGYRAHVHRPTPPKLSTSNIQGKQEMWRVTYTPHDQGPARLTRKAAVNLGQRQRIAITAITEEDPKTGRCITVDSADGLYLVGEGMIPTHNSLRVSCWYPLWRLTSDPTLRIAIVSYSQDKALRWGRWLRRMIQAHSELGIRLRQDSRAADRFETTVGGLVLCVGIEGGITGEPVDELVIDDPVRGRAEAESVTYRDHAWEWWESNASTRASGRFRAVLMMTRWHGDDLAGRLLKNEPGEWRVLRIPAVRDEDQPTIGGVDGASLYDPTGELLSVQNRPAGYFHGVKAKRSQYVWLSIYWQSPTSAAGNLFRRPDFRYWHGMPANPDRHGPAGGARVDCDSRVVMLDDCWRFATVDLAASKRTSADWTVCAVWAISPDGDLILLDRDRQRIEEGAHWALVQPLVARWSAPDVFVERGFIGTTLIVDATRAGLRIQPVDPDADKVTRALPATYRVSAHRVWFPASASWLDEWCDELAEFPAGAHDDQVDTLAYAARVTSAYWLPQESAEQVRARTNGNGHHGPIADAFTAAVGAGALDLATLDY